jgi:hypothetical protein
MKAKLVAGVTTFLFLLFLLLFSKQIRPIQYVARVETPSMEKQKELKSVTDLISHLDSTLTELRQMPDERWARNFFKPLLKLQGTTTEPNNKESETPLPHLSSILANKEKRYAILDGQIVRVGDVVKSMKVIKIEMGSVTLRYGDKTIVIPLD